MVTWRARWEQEDRERAEADAAKGIVREPEVPDPDEEEFEMGTPDDQISATIDVGAETGAKFDALQAHASQMGDSFWMKMGRERFRRGHAHRVVRARDEPDEFEGASTTSSRATGSGVRRGTPSLPR
jgi:LmbE family N-acetylglucosaminyl deacetylase